MAGERFASVSYPISLLVEQIASGELGLPDLQRPFVWSRSKVRDLFDSLYRGYPAGYFLFWQTDSDHGAHQIGDSDKLAPKKMIVDGQQRLTSLFAVMKGSEIITEDHERRLIRIAFNPFKEEFAVATASTDQSHDWLSNISDIWTAEDGAFAFITEYLDALAGQKDLSDAQKKQVGANLACLDALPNYHFSALELSADIDVEEVAEIFVRINYLGQSLTSADFILTLMSVYWDEGRHQLEDFSIAAKKPPVGGGPSPFNYFLAPSPDQMLRVSVGLAFKRGQLQHAYQVLRGRNLETGEVTEEARSAQFERLKQAQAKALNLANWHDYMNAVKRAGFRSGAMLTSDNNFLYGYLIYLIGRDEYSIPRGDLKEAIAHWFFMSSLTGRYTGSPESRVEADLRMFAEASTPEEFIQKIDDTISTELTPDFWTVTLPNRLATSAAWSPYLFAYYASLNLLEATALFSPLKISELLDPGVVGTKAPIERHHLFPKGYLKTLGINAGADTNQIANYAFVEWTDNAKISDQAPSVYFPPMFEKLSDAEKASASFWHALPDGWETMLYPDFLDARRVMLADVVRAGFERLRSGETPPELINDSSPATQVAPPTVAELLDEMEGVRIEFKASARHSLRPEVPEAVINEGVVKTVAAFLNTEGGTLAIGLSDAGDILGIGPDLELKSQDRDGYENWLNSLLIAKLSAGVVASHTRTRFEEVNGEAVCLIDVRPADRAIYASTTKGRTVFYTRVGNSTRPLEGPELEAYIRSRFG